MPRWVFGYGSLLWNPGFAPARRLKAELEGFHRSFCMLSIHHRGTETHPGLVLALDERKGAHCTGVAFEIPDKDHDAVLAMLRERELISSAYYETTVPLVAEDGTSLEALTYVINRAHRQYCDFDLETQAQMIASAVGGRGPNTEYLHNTAAHLSELGIQDSDIAWLDARVRHITGR